jgi:DNA polymerase-1
MKPYGVSVAGFTRDVMLEGFLLTADPGACSLSALSERFLGRAAGKSLEEQAACILALAERLAPEIDAKQLRDAYEQIELPLIPVLARMTEAGIRVEPARLQGLSREMDSDLTRLAGSIHGLAGHPFNINSPQQLARVLFDEMNLPLPVRYGRGKTVSTAADVLEDLAADHPIAQQVLDYRQLAKLKSTYIDALPGLINPDTCRLHTTFNQAGSATGRISSSNPNLQNIPIRTEMGREIRAAFVPEPGWKLVVADYSQIELRLLAHMSHDPVLLDAFRSNEDIHTRTAAEVFGVPRDSVSPEMRRRAKAVNFGIVYGQSAFGLANQLGIPRGEADTYIRKYFERYAGVRAFIDATIAEVKKTGEVRTLFGRLRPIPDMNSRNAAARGFAERTAVNTPLQGSAADLIKLAMIRIDKDLRDRNLRTRMLLQVHDELLFESPPEEVEPVSAIVQQEMEGVREFEVPIIAEVGVGENWRDAK